MIDLESLLRIKNDDDFPKDAIVDQMLEARPLPMGRKEFEEWSERIISGAILPGGAEDPQVFLETQKFALANMLMHLGPTESHKPDAFFIHSLRKFAINQVADTIRKELHEAAKARTAAAEEKARLELEKAKKDLFDDEEDQEMIAAFFNEANKEALNKNEENSGRVSPAPEALV